MAHEPTFVALSDQDFLKAAEDIVRAAHAEGTALRILGSLAIYAHSAHIPDAISLFHALGRVSAGTPLFTDLDLMGYAKQGRSISSVFEKMGFKPDSMVNGFFGDRRLIYYEGGGKFHVDIFLDKLEFSHDVEFGRKPGDGRLELDFPTITLSDIVLEKLQIHKIARKDLVDLMILFFGHDVKPAANGEKEAVDAGYISSLVADDWGFWYEATQNLAKTRQLMGTFVAEGRMKPDQVSRIEARIGALEAALHRVPKGRHWEKRAKAGTTKPWYREVEEVVR
ncbi:MAG TPA: hypothetical protein VEY12_07460 [Thermoplasmata archaeon]|nr:hypothetical protein [Thermoplasmata archaeon]